MTTRGEEECSDRTLTGWKEIHRNTIAERWRKR